MLLAKMQLFICNPKTVSLVQETEHDMDTDSDTSSDNSDTDMSDSDNC